MQLFNLNGKTVLITGASSGLGERFARVLSSNGARVILAARRIDKLEAIADALGNAIAFKMDVSDEKSVAKAFEKMEQRSERIDVCINNAGTAKWTPLFLDDIDSFDAFDKGGLEAWDEVMKVNLRGTWLVTQQAAAHMRKHKVAGSIINIASTLGANRPAAGAAASCASKAGIIHLTKQLVPELAKYKIRINCIIPGLFWSELTNAQLTKRGDEIKAKIPLGFVGETNDFDGAILYLASNSASRYTTGTCITIDGGASCGD